MAKLGPLGKLSSALRCAQSHTIRSSHVLDERSLKTYVVVALLLVVEVSVKITNFPDFFSFNGHPTTRRSASTTYVLGDLSSNGWCDSESTSMHLKACPGGLISPYSISWQFNARVAVLQLNRLNVNLYCISWLVLIMPFQRALKHSNWMESQAVSVEIN